MKKLDVGATLSRVFELYGKQAGVLLPAALLVFIPVVVVIAIISAIVLSSVGPSLTPMTDYSQVDPAQLNADLSASVIPLTILSFVSVALAIVGTYWYQGIVVNAVADMEDGKRDHTLGSLFSASMPFIGPLIGAGLLVGVAIIAVGIVIAVVTVIVPALAIIVMLLGVAVILWLVIRWSLISAAIVVEKKTVGESFSRSSGLVENNWWRVLGVIVVVGILSAIVSYILTAILGGIGGQTVGPAIANLVSYTLTAPLAGLAAAIMFFQLRSVKEGGAPAGDAPPAAAPPPLAAEQPPAAEPPPPPPPPAGPAA